MELKFNDQRRDNLIEPAQRDEGFRLMEQFKAFVLLGLAAYFTYNIINGDLSNYINMRFAWLSYVAVVLFTMLGIATVFGVRRGDFNNRTSDHTIVTWPILLIMAVPLVLGTLVPSRPLGAAAMSGGELRLTSYAVNVADAVNKDPLERDVLDWARAFAQRDVQPADFDGVEADVIGFVFYDPAFPEDHLLVARSIMSCCTADTQPVVIPFYWPEAAEIITAQQSVLADGQDLWVRVRGIFEAGLFQDTKTPILQVTELEIVDEPRVPYLYP
ncbi:MAG: TIGR03943 family putative permease subunit [Chloroflexota bacterium]